MEASTQIRLDTRLLPILRADAYPIQATTQTSHKAEQSPAVSFVYRVRESRLVFNSCLQPQGDVALYLTYMGWPSGSHLLCPLLGHIIHNLPLPTCILKANLFHSHLHSQHTTPAKQTTACHFPSMEAPPKSMMYRQYN